MNKLKHIAYNIMIATALTSIASGMAIIAYTLLIIT